MKNPDNDWRDMFYCSRWDENYGSNRRNVLGDSFGWAGDSKNGFTVTLSGFNLFDDQIQGFRFAPPLATNRRPSRAD